MTMAAPPSTPARTVTPEVRARKSGSCPMCPEPIVAGEHYIARVKPAPDPAWMHAPCAREYARHLDRLAEMRGEE